MAATPGNQFWKLRAKHGRDRIQKDPVAFAESIDEYLTWCIENPIIVEEYKSSRNGLEKVKIEYPRVFTKEGVARFCGYAQWRSLEELKEVSKDFSQVVTRTEGIIADQKYTYAVIGVFKENLVARDLSISDKQDIKTDGSISINITGTDQGTIDNAG